MIVKNATKHKHGKILEAVGKTANGLHAAGVMKQATKRQFDALCLNSTEPMKSAKTRALRTREPR